MAQATSTQLGEIKLAGDLAGSNNALIPELTSTGVTPGSYIMPTITVDAKGRILTAAATSGSSITSMLPDSTTSTKGVVQIGSGLNVAGGIVNADVGSTVQKGILQVGSGLTVSSGTVSIDWSQAPTGTTSTLGLLKVGAGLTASSGVISLDTSALPVATASVSGTVKVGAGLSINAGVLSTTATPDATTTTKGVVQIGSGLNVSSGIVNADWGSTSGKGILQVGDGLSVSSGTVSLNRTSYASAGTAGLIKVGNGLQIDGSGVLNINMATLPDATTSVKGLVTVGTGINIASGVISIDPLPVATASTLGAVKPGTNMAVDGTGALSVTIPDATASTKGIVKIDTASGLTISSGTLSAAVASNSGWGLVKVGSNLVVDGSGNLSVPNATTTVLGAVKVDGTSVTVDANGLISVGAVGDATTSTKGIVQIGSGLNVSSGVVSLATATSGALGLVKPDGTTITATGGVLSVNTAGVLTTNNFFTTNKALVVTPVYVPSQTGSLGGTQTVNMDMHASNTFQWRFGGGTYTIALPTNIEVGGIYRIHMMRVGSSACTFNWNAAFNFTSAYTFTGTAGTMDILEVVVIPISPSPYYKILVNVVATGLTY